MDDFSALLSGKNNRCSFIIPRLLLIFCFLFVLDISFSQAQLSATYISQRQKVAAIYNSKFIKGTSDVADLFGKKNSFIENIGQYGNTFDGYSSMGDIKYGYEGLQMPVLFTSKGIIFLQRKTNYPSGKEKEEMERKGMTEEEIAAQIKNTDRTITMEWMNANPNAVVIAEDEAAGYFTYGMLSSKARAFRKIICKDLYPGVDVEYYFPTNSKAGFEYNIILKPGADISKLKLQWGGELKNIFTDKIGNLKFRSDIGGFSQSYPRSFYAENNSRKIGITPHLDGNMLTFHSGEKLDANRTLVIDPFISSASNLTGTNTGKAKDVDFDYAGNVYVTGGGDGNVYQLAKFNSAGVWQWTFNGTLSIPSWVFGTYYGGWVVEKTTGKTYLGQGFNYITGFQVIRINTAGLYDNYITTANVNFREDWKMYWSCNNGSPQILIAGGGTNSNINFGICSPPSTTITSLNVTNIPYSVATGWAQDIADVIIDPVTNDMYTIYGSLYGTPSLSNMIYKNTAPYSGASIAWNLYSGYTVIQEIAGRPYMLGGQIENSVNVFAINSSYLFYWDGKNLKAFNKATGAGVGTPLSVAANTPLWCGGIIADECNNIFVGSTNGTIKVYRFNGSTFDDAAEPDINVTGYASNSVYDLAFDEAKTLLYASGDGFVASFDISSYGCASTSYTLTPTPDCATASVTTSISPAPPPGSIVTYDLYNGNQLVNTNSTGTFTGLTPGITYTIIAYINQTCSGTSTSVDFTLPGPALTVSSTNTLCGSNTGTITASGTGGTLPYTFSKDGITFQSSGSFTSLSAGVYPITIKDASGCSTTITVTIVNSNGPSVTFTKTDATCNSSNGTITANGSGGTPPLQYSIDGSTFQSNNFFTALAAGTYTLTVQDATGCLNDVVVTLNSIGGPTLTATPATTFCNTNNGSITAFASGGTAPLQYSLDGNNFQSSNVFNSLAAGTYTVTVKDANGCTSTYAVTVPNSAGPTVTATTTTASCGNSNGTITATGTGGLLPLQYSINGFTFQSSNFFGGLTAGSYTVTVKDANGCTSTVNITISASNAPSVTATSVSSTCNSSNGSVTASGSGGTAPLTYSINGFTFQSSVFFSGLAPGTYTILVKDANGCIGATTVTVNNTSGPTVSAITTPVSCGAGNGVITASGTGGTQPYQYNINGGAYQSSGTFSGLATGTYTVNIEDVNNCISSISIVLSNASGLSVVAGSTSTPCSGNNGSITALATGGIGALQYSIDGFTFQSSNAFTNIAAGTYTVTVTDANGCSATTSVTVNVVFAPTITATSTNANCNSNNGSITATGSGGTPPLQYSIDGSTFQSSNIFNGVAPGAYTVTVRDTAGCTGITSVTISNVGNGPPPIITLTQVQNVPCEPGDLGKIVVSGSGGTAPYTFSINGITFQTSGTFNNLTAGTYTLTIKDANGCTATITATVGYAPGPTVTATTTPATCGSNNGSIQASGSGNEPPFKYKLDNGAYQTSGTFTGLAPGTYTITIKDAEGCTSSITVTVLSTGGPAVTLTKTDASCGFINGTITAIGSGGTPPLTYNINNGAFQSSGIFSGLSAGTYTVLVKDATGCLNAATITLSAASGPSLLAVASNTTCGQANGSITASGGGGNGLLQYSINGTTFQSSAVFTGLSSGTYTVWVKDSNQCFTTVNVIITNTSMPMVTAYTIAASCGSSNGTIVALGSGGSLPYQFSIDGSTFQSSNTFSGVAAGAFTITIKDVNGCVNTTGVVVANLTAPTLTTTATSSHCGNADGTITGTGSGGTAPLQYSIDGVTFQSSGTFTNVAAGTYIVTVEDANGCIATKFVDVANVAGPSTLNATITDATCGNSNGKITASASGGTAPLQYSINGFTFQSGTVFNPVAAGTYTLWVKDANSCTKTLAVTVPNLAGPGVTASPSPSSCFSNDGTITATAVGGTGAITYNENGGLYQASNIFTGLAPGTYTINAKDANGCVGTTTATITIIAGPAVTAAATSSNCGVGTITATASGGTPPYQYSLDGNNFQTSNVFTCLLAGTYTVTVQDANGCIATYIIDVTIILPISLLDFNAVKEKNIVYLSWSTASEINSNYFSVEKLKSLELFESFDTVDAAGNSSTTLLYSTYDYHPVNGTNYYRLKQTDLNGDYKYSQVVSVDFTGATLFQVYPNPAGEQVMIVTDEIIQEIKISDVTGRIVVVLNGNYTGNIPINLSGISSGCYLLEATGTKGYTKSQMLIKSRNDGE